MSNNVLVFTTILVLLFTSGTLAQSYELDWENLHTTVREADEYTLEWSDTETSVSLHVPPKPVEKPRTNRLFSTPRQPEPEKRTSPLFAPQAHLNLIVSQWYDYDRQRYRVVDRVETTLYPKEGGIQYRTFENLGVLTQYDVFLKHLTPGSRYKAFIVWDDGSNRTVEGTVQGQGWRSVFIDEPDPLAYKVWPTR